MKTQDEMLAEIYEEISDKELNLGCYFSYLPHGKDERENAQWNCHDMMDISYGDLYFGDKNVGNQVEVYGSQVMIGDVLDWIEKEFPLNGEKGKRDYQLWNDICYYWELKRLPINSQSQECKEYVHSLIPKKD